MHLCKLYTSSTSETSGGSFANSYKRSGDPSIVSNVDLFLSLNGDEELMLLSGKN
jgi:hypothetical protein